jgi:predicted nucleic-acid-binding Zn-ribbon protein
MIEYLIKAYQNTLSPFLSKAKKITSMNLKDEFESPNIKNYEETVKKITDVSNKVYSAVEVFLEHCQYEEFANLTEAIQVYSSQVSTDQSLNNIVSEVLKKTLSADRNRQDYVEDSKHGSRTGSTLSGMDDIEICRRII